MHNSKNGGRTYFLKAIDDSKHSMNCNYKIGNYKPLSVREPENGYFTEEQINNHVKTVDKDVREPLVKKISRKKTKGKDKKTTIVKRADGERQVRKTANSGRVVYGEDGIEGTKGRMSRTYTVQAQDIGRIKTIYGNAKYVRLDEYGQLRIEYEDDRLGNIEVVAGSIIEHSYPIVYANLFLAEKYFEENREKKEVHVTTGGLITEKNGRIMMELLTDGGLRVDGKTINNLLLENMKNVV